MRIIGDDAICIVPAASEHVRNDSIIRTVRTAISTLTGFRNPDAVLALIPGREHGERSVCRERDAERKPGTASVRGRRARSANSAWTMRFRLATSTTSCLAIEGRSRVYYHFGRDAEVRHQADRLGQPRAALISARRARRTGSCARPCPARLAPVQDPRRTAPGTQGREDRRVRARARDARGACRAQRHEIEPNCCTNSVVTAR